MRHAPSPRQLGQLIARGNLPHSAPATGLAACAGATVGALLNLDALASATRHLAVLAWQFDARPTRADADAVLVPLVAILLSAWTAALVVGLLQTRARLARLGPRGRGFPDRWQHVSRASRMAIALLVAGLFCLAFVDAASVLLQHSGGTPATVSDAASRAFGPFGAVLLFLAIVAMLALASIQRQVWSRSIMVDERAHREERRRASAPAVATRERNRRRRELDRIHGVAHEHRVLRLVDAASRTLVVLAFHERLLPVPTIVEVHRHDAFAGRLNAPPLARLPRIDDGPLVRTLARVGPNRPIPDHLFRDVADIFAHTGIYRVSA